MNERIAKILKLLPSRPGVYQMFDAENTILYVGKSIHLKNRVSSYFNGTGKLNAAKAQMVRQVQNIEWLETSTEIEALVLETNLIKKYRPKYNILMKDDKNLSYVVISDSPIEEVFRTRQKPERGTFFWPYAAGANIGGTLRSLRQIFKIRSCKMKFAKDSEGGIRIAAKAGKTPPCMDYYIGLCPAPCLLTPETIESHQANVERMRKFLKWHTSDVVAELRERMLTHSKALEFEEAARIKGQIESIELLGQRQIVRDAVSWTFDCVLLLQKYGKNYLCRTEIRDSEVHGTYYTIASSAFDADPEEILEQYISENYIDTEKSWLTLLLEKPLISDVVPLLLKQQGLRIEVPEQGVKSELLRFSRTNLMNFAYRDEMENLTKKTISRATMENILTELGYESPKKWSIIFECYDNSHTNGQFTVASRSVMVNGKSEPSLYRKYKLKSLEEDKIDDFESMREIMERRIIEGFEQDNFPTMIIIDWGKWQLSSALEGVERAIQKHKRMPEKNHDRAESQDTENLEEVMTPKRLPYFCSIAKREEEIFVPGSMESTRFDPWTPELMAVQKIRDEAHRFAISFNRSARSKAMKKNLLEELPGFGPVTRKKLLKLAGSVDAIRELSKEDILSVCSIPQYETLEAHGLL